MAAGIGAAFGGASGQGFNPGDLVKAAVLGGVTSRITGGKFANGAAGAAFMYAVSSGVRGLRGQSEDVPGFTREQVKDIRKRLGKINKTAGKALFQDATMDDVAGWLDSTTESLQTDYGIEYASLIRQYEDGMGFVNVFTDYDPINVSMVSLSSSDKGAWHSHPSGYSFSADDLYNGLQNHLDKEFVSRGGGKVGIYDLKKYKEDYNAVKLNPLDLNRNANASAFRSTWLRHHIESGPYYSEL